MFGPEEQSRGYQVPIKGQVDPKVQLWLAPPLQEAKQRNRPAPLATSAAPPSQLPDAT